MSDTSSSIVGFIATLINHCCEYLMIIVKKFSDGENFSTAQISET